MSRRSPRRAWPVLLLGAVVLLVVVASRPKGASEDPLDPRSDASDGTSALVQLLGELGASVRFAHDLPPAVDVDDEGANGDGNPDDAGDIAVVLLDRMSTGQRDDLLDWVAGGGTLVVVDPRSPLAPPTSDDLFGVDPERQDVGDCAIDALRGIGPIEPGTFDALEVDDARGCFGTDDTAFVVATEHGDGTVVATASPWFLTNDLLDERDNAVLAAALLAPSGGEQVHVVELVAPIGGGDRTLADLVPDGVRRFLVQIGLAFLLYATWRAIRLGRPVEEPQAVVIAGSELVEATGRLLERTRDPARTAELVRADLRRELSRRLGVPANIGAEGLVRVVVGRAGVDAATAELALGMGPVRDDEELVAVTRAVARIRQEVLA